MPKKIRFALVPHIGCICEICLLQGSRGFVFREKFNPHGGKNLKCKCEFMPGIEGETKIDGYEPKLIYRRYERVKNSEIIAENLYNGSIEELLDEAESINEEVKVLFRQAKELHNFDELFLDYLNEFAGDGVLTSQKWAHMEGKEIQLCSWLAKNGYDIEFLRASSVLGDKTPDILLDGEPFEIKRITTEIGIRAKRRIGEALKQSENVIVDMSCNKNANELISIAIDMLDDKRAKQIIVIADGKATLYRK